MRRDIDDALRGWPQEPGSGELIVREVKARDGRSVVQVRVELGVLQMEIEGRPDGLRPQGFTTYLDYLRHRAASRVARKGGDPSWTMGPEHCAEVDRELVQFHQRRVAWLALQRYDRALQDSEHTLNLMDFVVRHGINRDYIEAHERLRGLVLFHRSQAAAALALERRRPDEAIEAVQEGIERLAEHHRAWCEEHDDEELPDLALIEQLRQLEGEVRKNFAVSKTLREQLDEAVAREDYECAARLRDQIRSRTRRSSR
jgi:hypothetical protein